MPVCSQLTMCDLLNMAKGSKKGQVEENGVTEGKQLSRPVFYQPMRKNTYPEGRRISTSAITTRLFNL